MLKGLVMNAFNTVALSLIFFVGFNLSSFAQSSIITTYAGRGSVLPVNGALAVTQPIDAPSSVIPDTAGGFYFASLNQHRVYQVAADGRLTVISGTGTAGVSGDGGPAFSAQLTSPSDLALDPAGNLFIAETNSHRIRKVSAVGIISTVAGTGIAGFSGDGGPAIAAELNEPSSIAVDAAGNLFIADSRNNRIRKVNLTGVVSTVAGTGVQGFSGDGGPATAAQLYDPLGVAVDTEGNLYIADASRNRIRKVRPDGIINTVAGMGVQGSGGDGGPASSAELESPSDVAVDAAGNLFIIDYRRIRQVTPAGVISTVAGRTPLGFGGDGGPAVFAYLRYPSDVAVDGAGNLLIADTYNNRIRKVNPAGIISTVAGDGGMGGFGSDGPAASTYLNYPQRVAVDTAGNLFIADTYNHRIRKVTPTGIISTVAGTGTRGSGGDGSPAIAAQLNDPAGVAVDAAGNLLIADTYNHRIRKVTPTGIISTVVGTGVQGFSGDGGPATAAELNYPLDVAADTAGNLFIVDYLRIRKITPAGVISSVVGTGTDWEHAGFSGDGGPATAAQLNHPAGVAVDGAGTLFIADTYNRRIRMVTSAGVITTVAGTGIFGFSGDGGPATSAQLSEPWGVAVDGAGNLLIADSRNSRIRKVNPVGTIGTIAGIGVPGFSGDFAPAASARLNFPSSVVVDSTGNLFIADSSNHCIRKVGADPTGNPGEPAVISAVYPHSGPTSGGSRIRVLGRNFQPGSIARLGGVTVSALSFKSAGELAGLTPPLAAGTYSLEVVQPDGKATLLPNAFTYLQLSKVAPSTPTTSQSPVWRIPFVVDSPEFRTNLGINNVGGVMAAVQISLVDHHGLLLARASTTVPPFGMQQINHITRYLESASTVTGREGYLILESNQDIRAWASQIDNASGDASLELARSDGAARVLVPSSVSNDQFSTRLTVINTSAADGKLSLSIRDNSGTLQATLLNEPIAGYGYLFFEDIHKAAGLTNTTGSIEIEGLNGIRVLATAHAVSNQRTGAYLEAVDAATAGRSAVLYALENADFRTNLGINNLGTAAANVTVSLVDWNGLPMGSLTTTAPPGGLIQINRVNLALGFASPGVSLEGTLRLEADQNIVAWTSQIDNLTQDSSLVVGKSLQAAKLLIPSTTRVGSFRSNLVVANLDASPSIVELKFRDVEGNLQASSVEVIPGNGLLSSADILSKLGMTGNYGPLEIVSVSGKPILALSSVYSLQRTAGTFEGVP